MFSLTNNIKTNIIFYSMLVSIIIFIQENKDYISYFYLTNFNFKQVFSLKNNKFDTILLFIYVYLY